MDANLTESHRVLAESNATVIIHDAEGRSIEVKKLSRRELMRHMRQWGPACNVEQWFALALMSASVRTLDGRPMPAVDTVDRVEIVADMLGDSGVSAVSEWYQDQVAPAANPDARQAAKN